MELRRVLEIFLRRWPIIVVTFVVSTALTFWWVDSKPDTYRASGTYIVRPRLDPTGQIDVRVLEALIKGVEIPATYASIARSDVVRSRARDALGPRGSAPGLRVGAEVVTGTNTVEISARARDPETARDFAVAVGTATSEYIDELNDTYRLELLDAPRLPTSPVDVKRNLTVVVGALLGAIAGFTLAAVFDALRLEWNAARGARAQGSEDPEPAPRATAPGHGLADVIPLVDWARPNERLDAHSDLDPQFRRALAAASRNGVSHSLGVLRIEFDANADSAQSDPGGDGNGTTAAVADNDRFEKLLISWGEASGGAFTRLDNGVFAVLLPRMSASAASKLLADWAEMLSLLDNTGDQGGRQVAIGVREYPRRAGWSPASPKATAE